MLKEHEQLNEFVIYYNSVFAVQKCAIVTKNAGARERERERERDYN